MTDTNRPQISISEDMLSRLPYELSTGVTATQEGMILANDAPDHIVSIAVGWPGYARASGLLGWIYSWPDVAKQVRFQKGEPWCVAAIIGLGIMCFPGEMQNIRCDEALHRVASMLADDAEAFTVLYWCIYNLGGES